MIRADNETVPSRKSEPKNTASPRLPTRFDPVRRWPRFFSTTRKNRAMTPVRIQPTAHPQPAAIRQGQQCLRFQFPTLILEKERRFDKLYPEVEIPETIAM